MPYAAIYGSWTREPAREPGATGSRPAATLVDDVLETTPGARPGTHPRSCGDDRVRSGGARRTASAPRRRPTPLATPSTPLNAVAVWTDPASRTRPTSAGRSGRGRRCWPFSPGSVYVNFLGGRGGGPRSARPTRRQLRRLAGGQAPLRPRQPVPPQPEHPPSSPIADRRRATSHNHSTAGHARRHRSRVARPIAFLSDLGVRDETVGVCHAVMRRIAPRCGDHRCQSRRTAAGHPDRRADPAPRRCPTCPTMP